MNTKTKECNNETLMQCDDYEPSFDENDVIHPCEACGQAWPEDGDASQPENCPDCGQEVA